MSISPGEVISGKFRVERVLGEGGMGVVVCATHLQLGQLVALKFMQKHALVDPEIRARFMREARATGKLRSIHAARVLDVGALDDGAPYIVMEYLEGADLSSVLRKRGRMPAHEAAEYVIQACEALAEAHALGIIHRDLKPANLFLTTGATGRPLVKVLDFGVSKVLREPKVPGVDFDSTMPGGKPRPGAPAPDESVVTRVTDLLGSLNYMAPEQIVSARDADAQSDVWSLGVILYRLVSGIIPFSGGTQEELIYQVSRAPIGPLRDYVGNLPGGFELIVAKCMERDKSRRFASVAELARALAPYAAGSATPSLERIAILESAGSGTQVFGGSTGFGGSALLRDHASRGESPSSPSRHPTPHGASTPAWTSHAMTPVAMPKAQAERHLWRYAALAGAAILFLAGMSAVVYKQRGARPAEPLEPEPSAPATTPTVAATPSTSAKPPPTEQPAPSATPTGPIAPSVRPTGGGRPRPRPTVSATPSATAAPTATGPDIPDTRQ